MPWECVLDLVERGAQISLKNRAGVTAADLAPSCLVARLQDQMLSDCWSGLGAGSSSTGTMVPQSSSGLEPAGTAPTVAAAGTSAARSSNPARILRKLRTASGTAAMRTESAEEASSASVEMLAMSSTGSVRTRGSRYSLDTGAAAGSNNNNYKVSYFLQIDSSRVKNINANGKKYQMGEFIHCTGPSKSFLMKS